MLRVKTDMAISLNTKSATIAVTTSGASRGYIFGQLDSLLNLFRKPVKSRELIFFSSQLSLMLEIGTSLANALRAIADQTKNGAFRRIIRSLNRDIEEGRQLSDALSRHPLVFNNTYTSMIKAGETGSFLKKALDGIVEMQEKRQELITQLRSTMTYPAILGILSIGVLVLVLVGILPKFAGLFEGKESLLPATTVFLMATSRSLTNYWWVYILSCLVLIIGTSYCVGTPTGRRIVDRVTLGAPVLSKLANKIYTAQLLRTIGHLMASQVPLLEALDVTRNTFRNQFYVEFINELRDHVQQGGRFAQPFSTSPYIMESVKQMVATGEEVGNLPTVMLRLAEFYDTEIDRELKTISSMIEPAALIVMGSIVGVLVSAVILPIFKISNAA